MVGAVKRALIAGLTVSLLGTIAPSANATFPGENGRIFVQTIVRSESSAELLYRALSPEGGSPRFISDVPMGGDHRWSPDRRSIAYSADAFENDDTSTWAVWIKSGDEEPRQLTNPVPPGTSIWTDADDWHPTWSPDGTQVMFIRVFYSAPQQTNRSEITVVSADGSEQTQLTDGMVFDLEAEWSPDGEQMVLVRCANGVGVVFTTTHVCAGQDLYLMNADGSNLARLGNETERAEADPDWSPDSRRIAYTCDGETTRGPDGSSPGRGGICIYNLATGTSRRIYAGLNRGSDPTWSPDGKRIAFVIDPHTEEKADTEIYTIRADGSGLRRITYNAHDDSRPQWLAVR